MDTKITTIKERILQVAKYKGLTNENFCKEIGITYSNFKGDKKNKSINSECLVTLLTKYSEISSDWLLLNKGDMLREKTISDDSIIQDIDPLKSTNSKLDTIISLLSDIKNR